RPNATAPTRAVATSRSSGRPSGHAGRVDGLPSGSMYFDEFKHQLPDIDEPETDDWLRSLDQVVEDEGENRARFLMFKLLKRARQLHVVLPPLTQTRYINTIS